MLSDLWIQTKDKTFVPLEPNPVQVGYLDELCPKWREGVYDLDGKREIILKARQFGFSTLILALFFLNTVNNADVHTVVVADKAENTATLFEKVRHFYEHLPDELKPVKRYSSKTELVFGELRSAFRVLTAGSKDVGHSKTIHNLHCSEVALWDTEEVFTGLLQTVPRSGTVFIESTAQGEGGVYYDEYKKAEKGESNFAARFYAWFQHDEYRTPPPDGWLPKPWTRDLWERLPALDPEQVYWWEQKRSEPGMGNLIGSQYPNNSKDAFRVAGTTFFTEWDEEKHAVRPFKIPWGWQFEAALDWGHGKPFGFTLAAFDWFGGVTVCEELYEKRVINREQARLVCQLLAEWEVEKADCLIHCDPSMWNVKTDGEGIGYRDIDKFLEAGLNVIPAANKRTSSSRGGTGSGGWDNVREWLSDTCVDRRTGEVYPKLRVFDTCVNLVRVMPQMKHSKTNPDDMESDPNKVEDHLPDCLRYLLNAHILAPKTPGEAAKERRAGFDMGSVDARTGERRENVVGRVYTAPSHQPDTTPLWEKGLMDDEGGREWTY